MFQVILFAVIILSFFLIALPYILIVATKKEFEIKTYIENPWSLLVIGLAGLLVHFLGTFISYGFFVYYLIVAVFICVWVSIHFKPYYQKRMTFAQRLFRVDESE